MKSKVFFRCICTALVMTLLLTSGLVLPQQEAFAAGEKIEWRPMLGRADFQLGADKADYPELYSKGIYGGEGYQYIQGATVGSDGTILMGQDMGAARVSDDFGKTWYTPVSTGLQGFQAQSCAIDPADSNVMMICMLTGSVKQIFPSLKPLEGVWRSTDKGQNWSQVLSFPAVNLRVMQDNFACYPITGGDPDTRVWRFAASAQQQANGGFFTSNDGGKTWTKVCELSFDTYKDKYDLDQHPTEKDTLYMSTASGVWVTKDGGKTWTQPWKAQIDGGVRALWVDPDDTNHIIVSVESAAAEKQGVWETADGGASWNNILKINPGHMAVGAKNADGKRMIYVHNAVGKESPMIRNFDGQWVKATLKADNPTVWNQQGMTGVKQACFIAHPTQPDSAIAHGRNYWWRSEGNGGTVWKSSSTNFFGPIFYDMNFDENDWKRIDISCQDAGNFYTVNGGDSFNYSQITDQQWTRMKAVTKMGSRTIRAIVRLPDPWPKDAPPPASPDLPGRCIATISDNSGGPEFIITQNKGQTTWNEWIEKDPGVGGGAINRDYVCYSKSNPNIVYAGPNISFDGGTTWTYNKAKTDVITTSQVSDTIYTVTKPSNNEYVIKKSTDHGETWKEIYHLKVRVMGYPAELGLVFVDPTTDKRIYTVDPDRDALLLKEKPDGTWEQIKLNLLAEYKKFPIKYETLMVEKIIVDSSDPKLLHALVNIGGGPIVWRGRMNDDFTACTWEDITMNAPRVLQSPRLYQHPVTGDIILGSGNGNFVFPAPDDWQHKDPEKRQYKRALWLNMPLPIPNGWDSYVAPAPTQAPVDRGAIKVEIDGKEYTFDPAPMLVNDRTMVPMRYIFEIMGATVSWEEATETVTAVKDDTTIVLQIGNTEATVNGAKKILDVPAMLHQDRTMVPLRFISESLGADVQWIEVNNMVVITTKKATPTPTSAPTTPAPSGASIITDFVAMDGFGSMWSVASNIQEGDVFYGDRDFVLNTVPDTVKGADWIKTANDSKNSGGTVATFKITADADVYIAHTDMDPSKPEWMSGYTDTGEDILATLNKEVTFSLYKKSFTAGSTIELGENSNNNQMYLVIVKKK
ncbi:MAG: hypothetical protein BWY15_00583 [Firmicutes bacterium ADurb.Bin193]|nr:MAG: hypothetical protein BWY15_00583 [Firmicutes bacterium ADurb.Bin193]